LQRIAEAQQYNFYGHKRIADNYYPGQALGQPPWDKNNITEERFSKRAIDAGS
jgi:hypothetical protein